MPRRRNWNASGRDSSVSTRRALSRSGPVPLHSWRHIRFGFRTRGASISNALVTVREVTGRRERTSDACSPRVSSQTRVDANTFVLFGGLGTDSVSLNDVWEYKVDAGNWTRLHAGGASPADAAAPTVPQGRVGHSAVVLKGDLWVRHQGLPRGNQPGRRRRRRRERRTARLNALMT